MNALKTAGIVILVVVIGLISLGIVGYWFISNIPTGRVTETQPKETTTTQKGCIPNWQCSSWSECSSAGIQTRTCSDLNNCGTVSGKPIESQSCTPSKSWHTITTITGTTSKKTDTFNIKGEKWKFTWSCDKANEYDGINIAVYKEGNKVYSEFLFMQKCPKTEETTFVYEGPGNYYFDVSIANINSWTIKVEDWY